MNTSYNQIPANRFHSLIFILLLGAGIGLYAVGGNSSRLLQTGTPYTVKSFSVSTPVHLTVRTSGGYIRVKSQNDNKVRVEMYVQRNGRYLTSHDTNLSNYEITIEKQGNNVIASARNKSRGFSLFGSNHNLSISFVVYTPEKTNSEINTSGGSISVDGLQGETNAHTSGGSIESSGLNGNTSLHTSGGSISISQFTGTMDAQTSGGSITVDNGEGDMDLQTSGGHISLNNAAGRIEAETSGGSIEATVNKVDELLSLKTSGGSVRAQVPSNQGYDIELDGNSVVTNLKNFNGTIRRNHVEGKIGEGGPRIVLQTSGGSVTLNQK